MSTVPELKKVDIGCGSNKKAGCIGIDCLQLDGVDLVLDVTRERIPLDDRSVSYIHSSHFFEHIKAPTPVFSEISRIAVDGAVLEIWTPYAHSDDAFCYGHEIYFTEEHWQHMCVKFPGFYYPILQARWLLKKIVYVVDPQAVADMEKQGFPMDFAIKYFKGVVREMGVLIEIQHANDTPVCPFEKCYGLSREGPHTHYS